MKNSLICCNVESYFKDVKCVLFLLTSRYTFSVKSLVFATVFFCFFAVYWDFIAANGPSIPGG